MKRYQIASSLIKAGVVPKEFLKKFDAYRSRIPEHSRLPKSKEHAYDKPLAAKFLTALDKHGLSDIKANLEKAIADEKIHKRFYFTDELQSNLEQFFTDEPANFFWNKHYRASLEYVGQWLAPQFQGIKAIELSKDMDVREVITNLKAQCGSISLNDKKEDSIDIIKAVAFYIYHNKKDFSIKMPAIMYQRARIGGYIVKDRTTGEVTISSEKLKYKSRAVWCIDAATILLEGLIARPMMDVLCRVKQYAGGKSDTQIKDIVRGWNYHNWLCIDYSTYDSSIPSWLIHDVFSLIRFWFGFNQDELINWIENQFIHTDVYDYRGRLRTKHKGVPSGSYFTQIMDSLVNIIMVLTWLHSVYGNWNEITNNVFELHDISMCIMGDDNIIFTKVPLNETHLSSYLRANFGITVKADKCERGTRNDNPRFLKREWTADGSNRDLLELCVEAVHSESYRDYKGKGFSPWHVIFGYYMCYPVAMKKIFSVTEIIDGMKRHGGVERIKSMGLSNMPGSMKVHAMTNKRYFDDLILDARMRRESENCKKVDVA